MFWSTTAPLVLKVKAGAPRGGPRHGDQIGAPVPGRQAHVHPERAARLQGAAEAQPVGSAAVLHVDGAAVAGRPVDAHRAGDAEQARGC